MWLCSEITLCQITVFMYQCSGQWDPSSSMLKKSLWFMLAAELLLQFWCLSDTVWINKVSASLSRTHSNLCSGKTVEYLCSPVSVKAIVFHILTGNTHWYLLEITGLAMEIKTCGRNTKTCYITTGMLCTGLVVQEVTSPLYWKEEFVLHSEMSVDQIRKPPSCIIEDLKHFSRHCLRLGGIMVYAHKRPNLLGLCSINKYMSWRYV